MLMPMPTDRFSISLVPFSFEPRQISFRHCFHKINNISTSWTMRLKAWLYWEMSQRMWFFRTSSLGQTSERQAAVEVLRKLGEALALDKNIHHEDSKLL